MLALCPLLRAPATETIQEHGSRLPGQHWSPEPRVLTWLLQPVAGRRDPPKRHVKTGKHLRLLSQYQSRPHAT